MVLQIIKFYEKQLGREISDAEREAVRTMHEEFRRLRAPDHSKEEGGLLAQNLKVAFIEANPPA